MSNLFYSSFCSLKNTIYAFLLSFIFELTNIQVESDALTITFRYMLATIRPEGLWENSVERMLRIPSVLAEVCSSSLWRIETRRFPDSERSIAWQVRLHDTSFTVDLWELGNITIKHGKTTHYMRFTIIVLNCSCYFTFLNLLQITVGHWDFKKGT